MVSAGSITVAVRVRPPTAWEATRLPERCYDTTMRGDGTLSAPHRSVTAQSSLREIVEIVDDRILTFDPDEKDRSRAFVERGGFTPPGTKRYKDRRFMFDRVFDQDACQTDVFDATSKPLLNGLLDGYNATVFAYGATGCGKTHTISGNEADPGIIYLTMAELFQRIEDRRSDFNVDIMVTFLEIYNEEIRDLLADHGSIAPRGGLQIREDKAVKVIGLVELRPTSAEEVKEIVLLGNTRRTQSPTHANKTSSRSHAVLQVHVTQSPRTAATIEQRTVATLSIIDLAGSERAAATSNMGQRMVEGANINKSLLALGNCINALCESGGGMRHVPYRNSKLTRLLKFSLGGNCKTVMIVCIAPTSSHFDDTHNTLIYAERATKIRTKVVTRNVVNVDRHVGQYVEAINRLNTEVAELKAKLAGKLGVEVDIAKRKRVEAKAEMDRQQARLQQKADEVRQAVSDGAACDAELCTARAKLRIIGMRLSQLDSQAQEMGDSLPSDLEAERGMLRALAAQEEELLRSESTLNARLRRSSNSVSMFDGMLRAVSEARSDTLDEISAEKVKADVRFQKADIGRVRAEAGRDASCAVLNAQIELTTNLVGILARCTVMLNDGSQILRTAVEEGRDGLGGTVRALSSSFQTLAESNNAAFTSLLGQSTAAYLMRNSSLANFSGHATVKTHPSIPKHSLSSVSGSPKRRSSHGKSPRKNARPSVPSQRRVSDKDKKKTVRFVDGTMQADTNDGDVICSNSQRTGSIGESESDWEDEKTDNASWTSTSASVYSKRPRKSILDPSSSFLRSRVPALGILAEDDENHSPAISIRHAPPFSDRGNQISTPPSVDLMLNTKARILDGSPARRGLAVPRIPGSANKAGRRKSHVGPVRSEKRSRRRSSHLVSPPRDGLMRIGVKRTSLADQRSPKRTKGVAPTRLSLRTSFTSPNLSASFILPSQDLNTSVNADMKGKPWR